MLAVAAGVDDVVSRLDDGVRLIMGPCASTEQRDESLEQDWDEMIR